MTSTSQLDRPRTGANQNRAGSPITQVRVREVYSMTDEVQGGTEWVPRFAMLEVSAGQAALVRGLFEFAAFVADHPEVPLPVVRVNIFPGGDDYVADVEIVNGVAESLGVTAGFGGFGHYRAVRRFGPVEVQSVAITHAAMEARRPHMSYSDNVQPDEGAVAGGSR
jgi:hypothetical protein